MTIPIDSFDLALLGLIGNYGWGCFRPVAALRDRQQSAVSGRSQVTTNGQKQPFTNGRYRPITVLRGGLQSAEASAKKCSLRAIRSPMLI